MKFSEMQKRQRLKKRNIPEYGSRWLCPGCGSTDFEVDYTRTEDHGIYRKRVCKCGRSFETFEKITKIH
jgi:hypothetical protein